MSLTQGGALTRFPWATFRGPFRAENWLSVRLSATLLSNEHDMGQRSAPARSAAPGVRTGQRKGSAFPHVERHSRWFV